MNEIIEAYITKWVLTQGILKQNVKVLDLDIARTVDSKYVTQYYHRGEWHRIHKEALEKAEEIRIKKIASLKKQLAKLEKLSFA